MVEVLSNVLAEPAKSIAVGFLESKHPSCSAIEAITNILNEVLKCDPVDDGRPSEVTPALINEIVVYTPRAQTRINKESQCVWLHNLCHKMRSNVDEKSIEELMKQTMSNKELEDAAEREKIPELEIAAERESDTVYLYRSAITNNIDTEPVYLVPLSILNRLLDRSQSTPNVVLE
jgi:hypothetical protein